MKQCKVCGVKKVHQFFMLDAEQKSVYKDAEGNIWHRKVCYPCFRKYVQSTSGKRPLSVIRCEACNNEFQQKTIKQFTCSKECYRALKKPCNV